MCTTARRPSVTSLILLVVSPLCYHIANAIEHRDGDIPNLDTGALSDSKSGPRWRSLFPLCLTVRHRAAAVSGAAVAVRSASAQTDVKRVVRPHPDIDHDSGLPAFPASEILVVGRDRHRLRRRARLRGYLPERWPKSFYPKPLDLDGGAYGPFPRSKRLTSDGAVIAVATPGHTPDHLSVIVEDGDAAVFIAGDASYSEATMLAGAIDGVSRGRSASGGDACGHSGVRRVRPRRFISPRTIRTRRSGSPSGGRRAPNQRIAVSGIAARPGSRKRAGWRPDGEICRLGSDPSPFGVGPSLNGVRCSTSWLWC